MLTTPRYLSPEGMFEPTGPWNLIADSGALVFLAGMRGIDPATGTLEADEYQRVLRTFANIEQAAASVGLDRSHILRLTVFVTDMQRHRPLVNQAQHERWAGQPFPPRSIIEVSGLNQDDFIEIEATLVRPQPSARACD